MNIGSRGGSQAARNCIANKDATLEKNVGDAGNHNYTNLLYPS